MMKEAGKMVLRTKELPCYLLIISLFFPTRGSIFGLSFYHILALALLAFLLSAPQKPRGKIPKFIWIYGFVLVAIDIYWFQTEKWWYYISNLLPYFLAVFFIIYGIRTQEAFERFANFIITVFTIYAFLCIVESITYYNIFDTLTNTKITEYAFTNEIRFGFVRNRGAVDISINNGMLQCLVLTLCSYNLATKRNKKYVISYFAIFLASFLTLSRGVWIQIGITQLMIVAVMPLRKKARLVGGALAVLLLVLFIGSIVSSGFANNIFEIVKNMFLSIASVFTGDNNSNLIGIGHRFMLWSWVYETVKQNLIFGLGIGKEVSVITTLGYNKISIEVMWLYLLYQSGIIGLANFILFQLSSLKYSIRHCKQRLIPNKYRNFNYYIFSASIGYFVALFACSGAEDLRFYYVLVAMGISYNIINRNTINKAT